MAWGKISIDKADKLFSIWIRLRDKECRRCHSKVRLNANGLPVSHQNSHFKGRRKESTRFMPENCDTLCTGCHAYFTENPAKHEEWQRSVKGDKVVDQVIYWSSLYKKRDREAEAIYWRQRIKQDYPEVTGY